VRERLEEPEGQYGERLRFLPVPGELLFGVGLKLLFALELVLAIRTENVKLAHFL